MNRIKELRLAKGFNMSEVAKQMGMNYTTYVNYDNGSRQPDSETLIRFADFYNTSIDYLIGRIEDNEPFEFNVKNAFEIPKHWRVPLLGSIACGSPTLAEQNIEAFLAMPDGVHADFCLRCKGDSMINARIFDGDIVYIRQQDDVDDGDIAAVLIDDEATLKRIKKFPDHIALMPENPLFKPLVYWENDVKQIRILGKAIAFCSTVR